MSVRLLNEHNLEFLSLKEGYTAASESTLVQTPLFLEITCHGSIIYVTTMHLPVRLPSLLYPIIECACVCTRG